VTGWQAAMPLVFAKKTGGFSGNFLGKNGGIRVERASTTYCAPRVKKPQLMVCFSRKISK